MRSFTRVFCLLLTACLVPALAFGMQGSESVSVPRFGAVADIQLDALDALSSEAAETPEKPLYTRTTTIAKGAYLPYINMTQSQLDGKELQVRFTGATPVLYPRQDGIGVRGVKAWLYWKRIAPDSVEYVDGTWKTARFTAASVAAAWTDNPTPLGDAVDASGAVVIEPGDFNLIRFTTEGDSCTIARVALAGGGQSAHPGKDYTVSGKTASDIVRDMRIGWNLGNTLESHVGTSTTLDRADIEVELYYSNPKATRELIQYVKAQGFNAIRVPVSWFQHIYDDGRDADDPTSVYHIDEAWLARVREVVDYCYDEGLYVTINTHHERLWLETPQFGDAGTHREQLKTELSAIWTQLAAEFADYDQRLVFEGMNEPRASSDDPAVQIPHDREWGDSTLEDIETLNQLNQAFVDAVRSVDSPYRNTRLLLMNTIGGGTRLAHISQMRAPSNPDDRSKADPYVGVSMHPYEPYHFSVSYGDSWSDQTWSTANQIELEQVMYRAYSTFVSKGVPVVLDEFNAQDYGNQEARLQWARAYVGLARGYGITCFLWDNGGKGVNAAGNRTAYVDRFAEPPAWVNENQAGLAEELVAAATDATADVAWQSALDTPVPDGSSPRGRQLIEEPATSTGNSICTSPVHMADIEAGDVAAEFEGAAPTLVMTVASGDGWTTLDPSYIAWNEGRTGGVAYWWPDHVRRTWLASTAGADRGIVHTEGSLRSVKLVSGGTSTTVRRFALTGLKALPDVSNGSYGEGVAVRLLYTRPVTLKREFDDEGNTVGTSWYTVNIDVRNPEVPGKDMAVRFTGATPHLVFVEMGDTHSWKGWTQVQPYATVSANDGTGQKVAFFSWNDIDETWKANRAKDGNDWQFDAVSVAVNGTDACNLVELVVLGGDERMRPAMRTTTFSGDDIVRDLYAGYNLGGHMEANYVAKNADGTPTATKDGGWGVGGDLDLEVHWSPGAYITHDLVRSIANRGFKAVRLPVTWFQHLHDEPGAAYGEWTIDRAWMARVHEIVDWCLEEDLYVIVNMHHENWIDRADLDTAYDNTDLPQKFRAVWTQIAQEFDGYDQRLVFEAMNEPHAEGDTTDREWNQPTAADVSTVNRLNADFVALMRSMPEHASRFLMVPPFAASSADAATKGFVVPDDPSDLLAVSLHNYTPHDYTHFFLSDSNPNPDPEAHVLTDSHLGQLAASFERIRLSFTSKGYRVVLGEFGVPYSTAAHVPDQEKWMRAYITHAKAQGIPCIYWRMDHGSFDDSTRWTVLDDRTGEWNGVLRSIVDIWFGILDGDDVEWGVDAFASPDEHMSLESGEDLAAASGVQMPRTLDYSDTSENSTSWRTGRLALTWEELESHELAVRFTGARPRLALLNGWSGDWWGVDPSVIVWDEDRAGGIAYFTDEAVKARWQDAAATKDRPLSDLNYCCVRTDSNLIPPDLVVQSITLLHRHDWGTWTRDVAATCEDGGELVRVCAAAQEHRLVQEGSPLGHDWGQAAYTWAADNSRVEAKAVCARDASHARTETASTTYAVKVAPTATEAGEGVYTASFADALFAKQEKSVVIPATGSGGDTGGDSGSGGDSGEPVTTEVVLAEGTPSVLVTGLDQVASALRAAAERNAATSGQSVVSLKAVMSIAKKAQADAAGSALIKGAAGDGGELDFYDLSLSQGIVTSSAGVSGTRELTSEVSDAPAVMTFAFPFDFAGRSNVAVYRYHAAEVAQLDEVETRAVQPADGTFYLDETAGYVYVYAAKFSTYAISYATSAGDDGSGSGDDNAANNSGSASDSGTASRPSTATRSNGSSSALPTTGDMTGALILTVTLLAALASVAVLAKTRR